MKKIISNTAVTISFMFAVACNGNTNSTKTDSSTIYSPQVPPAIDTMPVLHPGNPDSSGTITTPPTHDNNVIVPDTSARTK